MYICIQNQDKSFSYSQLQPRDPANTIVDPTVGSKIKKKTCKYIDYWTDCRPWLGSRGLAYVRPPVNLTFSLHTI